jgi:hypothetical protein
MEDILKMVKTTLVQTIKAKVQEATPGKAGLTVGSLTALGTLIVAKGYEILTATCKADDPYSCILGVVVIAGGILVYAIGAKYQATA